MDLLDYLEAGAVDWIGRQRNRYRPLGVPIETSYRKALGQHYGLEVLESARFVVVPQIENPDFYGQLTRAGHPIPLDFRRVEGITYGDVVLLRNRTRDFDAAVSLRFHELVHVVQYKLLGVPEFGRRYVRGWGAAGFDYFAIPLEVDAYELQADFERGRDFDVVEAVEERLQARTV